MVQPGRELPGEPDGLGRQVDVAGVALVEDQVEDAQHGGGVAGLFEPHTGDGAFGAADPLRHGRLGHQVRLGDLAGGEPADGPQGERDRGRRRQRGVRAQEVELERVVDHGRGPGRRLLVDEVLPPAARGVRAGGVEEPAPGHGDQPALRIARRVGRPHADRLDQGVLHGVLGRREVRSAADEDGEHAGREAPQEDLVHRGPTPRWWAARTGTGAAPAIRGWACRPLRGRPTAPRPVRGRARSCRRRSPSSRRRGPWSRRTARR